MVILGTVITVLLSIIFLTRNSIKENSCENHRELFFAMIDSGVVIDKFVDERNHAIRTVVVNANGMDYKIQLIPYDNWDDFERMRIHDVIDKRRNSFLFSINGNYEFELTYKCDYGENVPKESSE